MNKKIKIFALLAFVVFAVSADAQVKKVMVVKSFPTFTLQMSLNYNQSYLEFNGTYNNDFHSKDYMNGDVLGADKGLGGSITAKIALSGRGRLRLSTSLNYNNFTTYLFGKNNAVADIGNSSINVMSFGLGLEHNFTPNYKFKLFLGGEGTANMIYGKSTIWVENRYGTPYSYDVKIKNSFRLGAAFFAGAEYMLNDRMGLSLGFKYHIANLLLKAAKESDNPNEFELRDESAQGVQYAGRKTLAYISLMAGINFYWGVETTRYTIK
jgi:hypothetical protein